MKKRNLVIVSLLVLAMSVVFMGCPPEEDDPLAEANGYLSDMGYTGKIKAPAAGTYTGVFHNTNTVLVSWEGCTESDFNTYKSSLPAETKIGLARAAFDFSDNAAYFGTGDDQFTGMVDFNVAGGTKGGLAVAPNSIVVQITKKNN